MSTATRSTEGPAPPALPSPRPSRVLPSSVRVTLEADVYDALLELARRDFRKLEWEASFLLAKAIAQATREASADAA